MNQLVGFVLLLAALALASFGVWLVRSAMLRGRQENVLLRLRTVGDEPVLRGSPRDPALANPLLRWIIHWLWRLGYEELDPVRLTRALWAAAAAVGLVLLALGWAAGLALLTVVSAFTYMFLVRHASRRRLKILSQLPDFLESVLRVLAAGNTLEESLGAAASDSPEPIRPLFLSIGRQLRLGAPIEEVTAEAAEVYQIRDLKVLALAAAINRKYGGSLRNILKSLIMAIRTRETATRELMALTAGTRGSAVLLALIPASLTLYILVQNPNYYAQMWADHVGWLILTGSVLLQLIGMWVLWRMVHAIDEGYS